MKLGNLTADGNTGEQKFNPKLVFIAEGTWGSGTAKLQFRPSGHTTWIDVTGASMTADGYKDVELKATTDVEFRVNLAGSTSPDLNFTII